MGRRLPDSETYYRVSKIKIMHESLGVPENAGWLVDNRSLMRATAYKQHRRRIGSLFLDIGFLKNDSVGETIRILESYPTTAPLDGGCSGQRCSELSHSDLAAMHRGLSHGASSVVLIRRSLKVSIIR